MNILVTGVAGFIGFHVATALLEQGDIVLGIDNLNDYYEVSLKEARLKKLEESTKKRLGSFVFVKEDIAHFSALQQILANSKIGKIDVICHLAAQAGVRYSLTNPFVYEESNLKGTLNILELARQNNIKQVVFASSSSVYGGNTKIPFAEEDPVNQPISLYAATKRAGELICHSYHHLYGMNITCLRFFTVYGPYGRPDMAMFIFTKNILNGKPIEVYNHGKMKRDFTYIADIVSGVVASLDKPMGFAIINLGNSHSVDLLYFIACLEKELGTKAEKKLLPLQPGDVPETFADIRKAKRLLGFEPKTNIEEGIKQFVAWYQSYYPSGKYTLEYASGKRASEKRSAEKRDTEKYRGRE